MRKLLIVFLTVLLLPGCAMFKDTGSITFNKAGKSWATAFWDELVPYCNHEGVPIELRLNARVFRAEMLVQKIARPAYGFEFGAQVDAIEAAVQRAKETIAKIPDPYAAERRFNTAQLEMLQGFLFMVDRKHKTLLGIPNPIKAVREAKDKGFEFTIRSTEVSADVAQYCAERGHPIPVPAPPGPPSPA